MLDKIHHKKGTKVTIKDGTRYSQYPNGQLPLGIVGTICSIEHGSYEHYISVEWFINEVRHHNSYNPSDLNLYNGFKSGDCDYEIL